MESYQVYKPHLRAGIMPSSEWPTQEKLNGAVGDFFAP